MSDAGGNATNTTIAYKTMTVQVLRGTESRAVRKWEDRGWELVSQTTATVRTELVFRRPKPTVPWRLIAVAAAVVVVALAIAIPLGIASGRNDDPTPAAAPASSVAPAPTEPTSAAATTTQATSAPPASTSSAQDVVLTPQNSPELAAILALGDYCDPAVAAFVAEHEGDTISFDGTVVNVAPRGSATTRYDILIYVGDDPETATRGPAFQFQDVNPTFDLNFRGDNGGYRASLNRVETRLSARHPITLGRLLAWESRWLHVGPHGDTTCPTCAEMRTSPAPVRSRFIDRAWRNL